jgi:hypothetical protein
VFGRPGIASVSIRSFISQTRTQLLADELCDR